MSTSINRRSFLKLGGTVVAGAGLAVTAPAAGAAPAAQNVGRATLPYPVKAIARVAQLTENVPFQFSYPDAESPCVMLKTGTAVPGGVGPQSDIVAYSTLCTHMGCPVVYDGTSRSFKCPCHFSIFDAEEGGQMVCGQATENLPQIVLRHDASKNQIIAIGVDGLIYGRQANLL